MAARYIIFDGHIPVVFPDAVSFSGVVAAGLEHKLFERASSSGSCFYDKGWKCFATANNTAKQDAEILNRHLCN